MAASGIGRPAGGCGGKVDAPGLGPGGQCPWGFESLHPHRPHYPDSDCSGMSVTSPDSLILRVPCLLGGCCDDVVAPRYRGAGLTLPDSGAWCLYEDLSACPPGAGVGFRLEVDVT